MVGWAVGKVEREATALIADAIQVELWRMSWREVHEVELVLRKEL